MSDSASHPPPLGQYDPYAPVEPVDHAPPPPGKLSGSYIDKFNLEAQLLVLRQQLERRVTNIVLATRVAAVMLMLWSIAQCLRLGILMGQGVNWRGDAMALPAWITVLVLGGLVLWICTYAVLTLITAPRMYPYYYRLACQRLLHTSEGTLYVDEERLQLCRDSLPNPILGAAPSKHKFTSLIEQLEFCSYFLPALRSLCINPERPARGTLTGAERARTTAKTFNTQTAIWVSCGVGILIGWALLWLASAALNSGPLIVRASASLAAFIDFYLEQPQLVLDGLPPPDDEPRGWLARMRTLLAFQE